MRTDANIHETDGVSVTEALPELNPPADFGFYHARRELIAKRNAETDPVKREAINLLIEQMTEFESAEGEREVELAKAIVRQTRIVAEGR